MRERLEAARKRLAEVEAIENPDDMQRGSMVHLRGVIEHLERMTDPQK